MDEMERETAISDAVAAFQAGIEALQTVDLHVWGDDLVFLLRELEAGRRRLDSVEQAVIAKAEAFQVPFEHGCTSTTVFLRQLLKIHPNEASARVKAARRFGPRRHVTGEPVAPEYPALASAIAAGEVSTRHATLIADAVDKPPTSTPTRSKTPC